MSKYNTKSLLRAGRRSFYKKLSPTFTSLSSRWLKFMLETHKKGEAEEAVFSELGIRPILDHYYQPLINPKKHLKKSLRDNRRLPGIDFNDREQLDLLDKFDFNTELLEFPVDKRKETAGAEFFYNNGMYCSGDAEYLYNMIRLFKPSRIIEIGSGQSTLMALNAIDKNKAADKNYHCDHICIEPFEEPWLETKNIKVIRSKVEDLDIGFFEQLESNDILFIDSSHIIRPQGDVLFEYLEILPVLKPGVIVHIHDIFTPKDYPDQWIFDEHRLWNEQYLLEAFLSFNGQFEIIGATNYLSHHYTKEFSAKCPVFAKQPGREPGAFWMRRV
jgi:predicted O-methyltransferase YrrM